MMFTVSIITVNIEIVTPFRKRFTAAACWRADFSCDAGASCQPARCLRTGKKV